jgi:4-methyl-5(b-hydroxyethyl)-thiazole monophosphate biosynthesis
MPRACVLLAAGFEEIEAVTIIDVLRRAEVEVITLSIEGGLAVRGSHGITVEADRKLADAQGESWDAVLLPGGIPGATNLRDSRAVQDLIKKQHGREGRIGAICAAPIALGAAGVLAGRKATSYPGFEKELRGATCVSDRVVRDGNITTSRGPGTALDFALAVAAELRGAAVADTLRRGMLVGSSA